MVFDPLAEGLATLDNQSESPSTSADTGTLSRQDYRDEVNSLSDTLLAGEITEKEFQNKKDEVDKRFSGLVPDSPKVFDPIAGGFAVESQGVDSLTPVKAEVTSTPGFSRTERIRAVEELQGKAFMNVDVPADIPKTVTSFSTAVPGGFAAPAAQVLNPDYLSKEKELQEEKFVETLGIALNVGADKIDVTSGIEDNLLRTRLAAQKENPQSQFKILEGYFGKGNVSDFQIKGKTNFIVNEGGKVKLVDERGLSGEDFIDAGPEIIKGGAAVVASLLSPPSGALSAAVKTAAAVGVAEAALEGLETIEDVDEQGFFGRSGEIAGSALSEAALEFGSDLALGGVLKFAGKMFKPLGVFDGAEYAEALEQGADLAKKYNIDVNELYTPGVLTSREAARREAELASISPNSPLGKRRQALNDLLFELEGRLRGEPIDLLKISKNFRERYLAEQEALNRVIARGDKVKENFLNQQALQQVEKIINPIIQGKNINQLREEASTLVESISKSLDTQVNNAYDAMKAAAGDVQPIDMKRFADDFMRIIEDSPNLPEGEATKIIYSFLGPNARKSLSRRIALDKNASARLRKIKNYIDEQEGIKEVGVQANLAAEEVEAVSRGRGTGEYDLEFPEGPNYVIVKTQVEGARGAERTVFFTYDAADYQANGSMAMALDRFDRLKDAVDGTKQAVIRDIDADVSRQLLELTDPGEPLEITFEQLLDIKKNIGRTYSRIKDATDKKSASNVLKFLDDTLEDMAMTSDSEAKELLNRANALFREKKVPFLEDRTLQNIIKRDAAGRLITQPEEILDALIGGKKPNLYTLRQLRDIAPDKNAFNEQVRQIILGREIYRSTDNRGNLNLKSIENFLGQKDLINEFFPKRFIRDLESLYVGNPYLRGDNATISNEAFERLLKAENKGDRLSILREIRASQAAQQRKDALSRSKLVDTLSTPNKNIDLDADSIFRSALDMTPSQIQEVFDRLDSFQKKQLGLRLRQHLFQQSLFRSKMETSKLLGPQKLVDPDVLDSLLKEPKTKNAIKIILGEEGYKDMVAFARLGQKTAYIRGQESTGLLKGVTPIGLIRPDPQQPFRVYARAQGNLANASNKLVAMLLSYSNTFTKLYYGSDSAEEFMIKALPLAMTNREFVNIIGAESENDPRLRTLVSNIFGMGSQEMVAPPQEFQFQESGQ